MRPALLLALLLSPPAALPAQLPSPNAAGVSAGHHILRAGNLEATNRFWTTLGGEPASLGPIGLVKFPGVLLYISAPRGDTPASGGSPGSSVECLTFRVRDLARSVARWRAAGIEPISEGQETRLVSPDGVEIRIVEDPTLATPIASDGVIMNVADAGAAAACYAQWFGAQLGERDGETIGSIPGARIVFRETAGPIAPTRGRALGLLGFEVEDLARFVERYRASGAELDGDVAISAAANLSVVQLTDPWGTSIEVSQGLDAVR